MDSTHRGVPGPVSQNPEMDHLVSQFIKKLDRFESRYRDLMAKELDALADQLDRYNLIYAFPVLKLHSHLLCRIGVKGILVISWVILSVWDES